MTSFMKTKILAVACLMPLLATFILTTSNIQPASAQTQAQAQTDDQTLLQEIPPQTEAYPLGIEIADQTGQLTAHTLIEISDENGQVFAGYYNDYTQWLSNDNLPAGIYYIVLTPPTGTYSTVDGSQDQYALATTAPNVYTVTLNQTNLNNKSLVFAAFQLHALDTPQAPTKAVTIEIRDLNGMATNDATLTLYGPDGSEHAGHFNPETKQWMTTNALLPGNYTIHLAPPAGIISEIDSSANQQAIQTSTPNIYMLNIDQMTAPYAAFQLTEIPAATYQLAVETTDENDTRVQIPLSVSNQTQHEIAGTYDNKDLWKSQDRLQEGHYTLTLTPPEGMTTQIDNTLMQFSEATDQPNTYNLTITEERYNSTSTLYAAFKVQDEGKISHTLGLVVRDLSNIPTASVTISVTTSEGNLIEGSYDNTNHWTAAEPLAPGEYIIELETPADTQAVLNEAMQAFTKIEAETNRFRLTLNKDTYGVLNLVSTSQPQTVETKSQELEVATEEVKVDEPTSTEPKLANKADTLRGYIGVEIRSLEDLATDEVALMLTDTAGRRYAGSYNDVLQWLSLDTLPAGSYTLDLITPVGTKAVINTMAPQLAVASDQVNHFTLEINQENLQNRDTLFAAFRLVHLQQTELPQTGDSLPVALTLAGLLCLVTGTVILVNYLKI